MGVTMSINPTDLRLARRGLPAAETWHLCKVVAITQMGTSQAVTGWRITFEIVVGDDTGFRVSFVVWAPQAEEPQDHVLTRLRALAALGLLNEDAEGQVEIQFDKAVGRETEVYVVHVVNGTRVYANGVEIRATAGE